MTYEHRLFDLNHILLDFEAVDIKGVNKAGMTVSDLIPICLRMQA